MTNSQTLATIEGTNPVLTVAPLKEETEMRRGHCGIRGKGKPAGHQSSADCRRRTA